MHSRFSRSNPLFYFAPRFRRPDFFGRSISSGSQGICLAVVFLFLSTNSGRAAQLTVSWDDNSKTELGFKVERSTNGSTFTTIGAVGANITSYSDASVTSGTKYWYRVRAYDLLTVSSYSNVVSATAPTTSSTSTSGGTPTQSSTNYGRIRTFTARAVASKVSPQPVTLGFTVAGANKSILLRGVGPSLAAFTSSKTLPDPALYLYNGTTLVGSNNNWGGTSALIALFKQVGAFPMAGYSNDAALSTVAGVKSYSAVVNGDYSGLAQAEIYDADTATIPPGRFSKLSARSTVGTGSGVLIGGFVITGDTPIKLLIRAIGPSLGGSGFLADPVLSIYQGSALLKNNDNWGGSSTLSSAFTQVGASSLSSTSKDSAIVISLSKGTYSATVAGLNSTTGIGRLEIYEIR